MDPEGRPLRLRLRAFENDGKWLKTGHFSSLLPNALPSRPDIDSTRENVLVIREDVSSNQLIPLVNAELAQVDESPGATAAQVRHDVTLSPIRSISCMP